MWVDGVVHSIAETVRAHWPEAEWGPCTDRGDAFYGWPVLQIGAAEFCLPHTTRVVTKRLLEGKQDRRVFDDHLSRLTTSLGKVPDDRPESMGAQIAVDTTGTAHGIQIIFDDASAYELSAEIDQLCAVLRSDPRIEAVHREDRELVIVAPRQGSETAWLEGYIQARWRSITNDL